MRSRPLQFQWIGLSVDGRYQDRVPRRQALQLGAFSLPDTATAAAPQLMAAFTCAVFRAQAECVPGDGTYLKDSHIYAAVLGAAQLTPAEKGAADQVSMPGVCDVG